MRKRSNTLIVFSIILLIISVYSVVSSICSFANNSYTKELFDLLNSSASFLVTASLSCFVFANKKLNIRFLVLPCVFFILNLLIVIANRFINKVGSINAMTRLDVCFFVYCCFGIISFILVAIDLNKRLKRSKLDIKLLFTYWSISVLASAVTILGVSGSVLRIFFLIVYLFSPIVLLIFVLLDYQKDLADLLTASGENNTSEIEIDTYDDLMLCRLVDRIYTYCGLNDENEIAVELYPDIINDYFTLENQIKSAFQTESILLYPSVINSPYDNELKTTLATSFIFQDVDYCYNVPNEIITVISQFGKKAPYTDDVCVYWGYLGRVFDRDTNKRFVTNGLQITDTIAFDLPTFSNASKDALYCQLVHELLHTVGLDENEVNNCIMPACIAALTAAKPFIDMLMDQREEAYLCFEIASKSVRENNTDLTNKLIAICEKLSDFPASPDDVIYTDTYATIYNTLSVECINTIFM